MKKYTATHMVKMEDLNHHGSLYAGRAGDWLMETSFIIATQEYGEPRGILYRNTHSFEFTKPIEPGSIITLEGMIVRTGRTSITMHIRFVNELTRETHAEGYTTFVTIDPDTRKPVAHGIELDFTGNIKEMEWRNTAEKFFA